MRAGVIETCGESVENLVEVAVVLHDMVESFKNALELFVDCSQNVGLFLLILDDMLLIGDGMSLHLSNL